MRPFGPILYIHFIGIVLSFLLGCAPQQKPTLLKLATLPQEGVCGIAVLPFVNETDFSDGDLIFYRVFTSELNRFGNFELSPEGDVRNTYRKVRLASGLDAPDFNQLRIIGNYLNVPLLIFGYIKQMEEVKASVDGYMPYLAVNIKIFDVGKGQTIWSTYYDRKGEEYRRVMHFGIVNNITRLSRRSSEAILTLWEKEGFIERCSEVSN
ncbi:MAG: hypothetical protein R3297_11540 [Desulfobulbales bacterium]|nr:hypothetical protein [Desulfobulbales bacterium]